MTATQLKSKINDYSPYAGSDRAVPVSTEEFFVMINKIKNQFPNCVWLYDHEAMNGAVKYPAITFKEQNGKIIAICDLFSGRWKVREGLSL